MAIVTSKKDLNICLERMPEEKKEGHSRLLWSEQKTEAQVFMCLEVCVCVFARLCVRVCI